MKKTKNIKFCIRNIVQMLIPVIFVGPTPILIIRSSFYCKRLYIPLIERADLYKSIYTY